VLVVKNKKWLNAAKPIMKELWDTVIKERKDGYEHRAPKKRSRNISTPEPTQQICLIDINVN